MKMLRIIPLLAAVLIFGTATTALGSSLTETSGANPLVIIVSPDGLFENPGTIEKPTTLEGAHDIMLTLAEQPSGGTGSSLAETFSASPIIIFVSPDGVFENPGTLEKPTTLEGAREIIQSITEPPAGGTISSSSIPAETVVSPDIAATLTASPNVATGSPDILNVTPETPYVNPDAIIVSPDGLYNNPGTLQEPTTLEGARDKIRYMAERPSAGIQVLLRGGTYYRQNTFELSGLQDSGTENSPITYEAYPEETPRIIGAVALDPDDFQPIGANDPVWNRLHPDAKGHVLKLDLRNYMTDFGTLETRMGTVWGAYNSYPELFFKDRPMELARYPDRVDASLYKGKIPESLEVFSPDAIQDISGTYTRAGERNGYPYYELKKGDMTAQIFNAPNYHYFIYSRSPSGAQKWHSVAGTWPSGTYSPDVWCQTPGKGNIYVRPSGQDRMTPGFMEITDTDGISQVVTTDEGITRWGNARNAYAMGFWKYSYRACSLKVSTINADQSTLKVAPPDTGINADQPFFVYNLLEELSAPNEWFLDTESGMLYFYPPETLDYSLYVSLLQDPLVNLDRVEHMTLKGIILEMVRDDLLVIKGGNHNKIEACTLRNCGGDGSIINGKSNGLNNCEIYNTGACGVQLCGGDRYTLTPGNNYVRNCEIHHFSRLFWTYRPGIRISNWDFYDQAVGQIVEYNHIYAAPHQAIWFAGNNHRIAFNNIHDVCEWFNDAGAIYAARDWGAHGNQIQNNFIHHINSLTGCDVYGIYLDDMLSGTIVNHNIFYQSGPKFACFLGGGRDNHVFNNIFCGSAFALHTDNRGAVKIKGDHSIWDLLWYLKRYAYQNNPWKSAYPEAAQIPDSWEGIKGTHWLLPEGCTFSRNVSSSIIGPIHERNDDPDWPGPKESFAEIKNNIECDDPLFTDEESLNLNLQSGSPAFSIPGFENIRFNDIGPAK